MEHILTASPTEAAIAAALAEWPELAGQRIRPLLITAFGDIYVEAEVGGIWVARTIELECVQLCDTAQELHELFSDSEWAEEQLITDLALLAKEYGFARQAHQVFAFTPHPALSGELQLEHIIPMEIQVWHSICAQLRHQIPSNFGHKLQ